MDWKGLLNWSLNYQDGTVNKNLKPMTEENAKFIEAAFESVCINEMKEIMKILNKLKEPEEDSEENCEMRCELIEELTILVDGPENGRNLVRAKRFSEIVNYFFNTKHLRIKLLLASLLGSVMQNDKFIQSAALDLGIFKILEIIHTSEDQNLVSKCIYVLTGILYGEFEKSKSLFLENFDGMKLLYNLLIKTPRSSPSYKRILNIIKELTKIEDKEAENFKVRFLSLNKIKEIKMHILILDILLEVDYNCFDNLEIIKIVMEVLTNTAKLFESLDPVFKSISELNSKLNDSQCLSKEEIKEEKVFLIEVLKNLKLEHMKQEEIDGISSLVLALGEDDCSKPSLHIQLK